MQGVWGGCNAVQMLARQVQDVVRLRVRRQLRVRQHPRLRPLQLIMHAREIRTENRSFFSVP